MSQAAPQRLQISHGSCLALPVSVVIPWAVLALTRGEGLVFFREDDAVVWDLLGVEQRMLSVMRFFGCILSTEITAVGSGEA